MTRKDYRRAAELVRVSDGSAALKDHLCQHYITFFKGDNAAFDADKFRAACFPKVKMTPRNKPLRDD